MIRKKSSTIVTFYTITTKYYLSILELNFITVLYKINREYKYLFSLTSNHSYKIKVFVNYYYR